jgi:glutathionylspermidine synthase
MIQLTTIDKLPTPVLKEMGWEYLLTENTEDYLINQLVKITPDEKDVFENATNRLYSLYVDAAGHVIENKLLDTLGINANLHKLIEYSWENDHPHLMGRFDFAGGIDNLPLKLLEFNADTPTGLPESALVQWAQLKANSIDETLQFNYLYEQLSGYLTWIMHNREEPINRNLLVSCMRNAPEDEMNVNLIMQAAQEAGFEEVLFAYVDEVVFSETEGIFCQVEPEQFVQCGYWFKLVPWEYISNEEPELCNLLTAICTKKLAIVMNPAYTLIFQSKAIMKYLTDLYPHEPLLLRTTFTLDEQLKQTGYVTKSILGREGANVKIVNPSGQTLAENGGDYSSQPHIFQELAPLATDSSGNKWQAGVWYLDEACGLSFRTSQSFIIDNAAQFAGHCITEHKPYSKAWS